MRVLITGAGGFLGRRLAKVLLAGSSASAVTELVLTDRAAIPAASQGTISVRAEIGDLTDPGFIDHLAAQRFDSVFHLAASLTLDAERDPALAYATNVEPLRRLIEAASGLSPRLIFASSIAVFGGDLPDIVDDTVRAAPTTTYGVNKAVAELLVADYSRLGRIDGRVLRLPIVLTRPGAATSSVSDRIAAIIREPMAGRDVICPVAAETRIPIASAGAVTSALVALHDLDAAELRSGRVMNLPALTVQVGDMIAALKRRGAGGRISVVPDDTLQRIVDSWPKQFVSQAATRLKLGADPDFAAVIEDYLANATESTFG